MAVGLVLCLAFLAISFWLRPQPSDDRVLVKADRLVRTAGEHQQGEIVSPTVGRAFSYLTPPDAFSSGDRAPG
ncbi:hypothetical protein [Bradyrhizobium sp. RDM4]|uniref:hypothetical protein n=1 Tax=Bradyrhizobium sp. RDM4 TaxID=3378765 RepID=UPI0038FD3CD5